MTVKNVGRLTGVSDHKIWRVLDVYVDAAEFNEDFSETETVGIDETSIAKGHDYITLFVDLKEKKTVHVGEGKSAETVKEFAAALKEKNGTGEQIQQVGCDMSPAFIKGVGENLPNAEITFDKFHIVKIINEAVDQVRREETRNNPPLKGTGYIFLKNDSKLTLKQQKTKKQLSLPRLNLKSVRAVRIRETFQQIYQAEDIEEFTLLLKRRHFRATHCRLPPVIKAAKTIERHREGVVNRKKSQINNGILEGLNSVPQAAKRKARGYKSKHFRTIAYLLTGKLDFSKVNPNCLPLPT